MDFLYSGLLSVTWQQLVMYAVGGILIWLAISKDFEPALLLPRVSARDPRQPTGVRLCSIQVVANVGESSGIVQWLTSIGY
jgi:oxaloacetate decarboxylase beta subunit